MLRYKIGIENPQNGGHHHRASLQCPRIGVPTAGVVVSITLWQVGTVLCGSARCHIFTRFQPYCASFPMLLGAWREHPPSCSIYACITVKPRGWEPSISCKLIFPTLMGKLTYGVSQIINLRFYLCSLYDYTHINIYPTSPPPPVRLT